MKTRICVECGEEFHPRSPSQITCSEACRKKRKYQACLESLERKRAGLPSLNKKKYPEQVCVICGCVFSPNCATAMTCGGEDCTKAYRRQKKAERKRNARKRKRQNPQGLQELMGQLTAQGLQYAEYQKIETLAKIKNTGEV